MPDAARTSALPYSRPSPAAPASSLRPPGTRLTPTSLTHYSKVGTRKPAGLPLRGALLACDRPLLGRAVSHDLNVIRYLSDRVAVMHLGRIVELAPATELFERPRHPYTRALMDAAPRMDVGRVGLEEAPSKADAVAASASQEGCRYRQRCPVAMDVCTTTSPPLVQVGPDSWAACHAALPNQSEPEREQRFDALLAGTPPGPQ